MTTGSYLQKSPTPDDIALGACNYGYWGAGLITPHAPLKEVWWTDGRIVEHVNRRYVISHIRGQDIRLLDENITIEPLTDDTYMEWILYRAPRLFRILVEIDCADRIFSLIDDGWQDEDLPLPLERIDAQKNSAESDIQKLKLSMEQDEELERRFYDTQFRFLHRQLHKDSHIAYGPHERIPIEYEGTIPPARAIDLWCRVQIPPAWNFRYVRRHFKFDNDDWEAAEVEFLEDIRTSKKHEHEHICDIWASYTSETEHAGYTLSSFIGEHTLLTFMRQRTPPQYVNVAEHDRPGLLLEWMHCLADGVASLHKRDNYHGDIRPSNILIDSNNRIAFSDIGHLKTFKRDKRVGDDDPRFYQAPEQLERILANGSSLRDARRCSWSATSVSSNYYRDAGRARSDSTNDDKSKIALMPCPVTPSVPNFSRILVASPEILADKTEPRHWETSWITLHAVPHPIAPQPCSLDVSVSPGTAIPLTQSALPTPPLSPVFFSPPTGFTPLAASISSMPASPRSPSSPYFTPQSSSRIPSPPTSPRSPTFLPHLQLSPLTSNPLSTQDVAHFTPQATDVFSLGCIYLDILTFLILGKTTTLESFRRANTATASPGAALFTPQRSGAVTPTSHLSSADSTGMGFLSSASSIISSTSKRTIFTRRRRTSQPTPHFASDPDRVAAWTEHLLLESAKRALPCHSAIVELLVLVRAMLAPSPLLRPDMSHVRALVEEVAGKEKAYLCCRGREWSVLPESGEGVDKGRRMKEPAVPREVLERLWELKKDRLAQESREHWDRKGREEERRKSDGLRARARQTVEVAASDARRSKVISVLGDEMDDGRRRTIGLLGHTFARIRKKPVIKLTPRTDVL